MAAGAVLTGLLIPAGMGYARVSGLPEVTGLYATIVGLAVYALVGPSRVLVLGPDSSLAPIIAAAVLPLAEGDSDRAVALAGLLAILTGAVLLAGGLVRLGFVADLLSKPIRIGFLNGISVVIAVSQLGGLTGISVDPGNVPERLGQWLPALADGELDGLTLGVGAVTLATILVLRRLAPRIPGILVAVVLAGVVVAFAGLDVPVVGELPRGLPAPALGGLQWSDVSALLPAALGLAIVGFADTGVLSRTFALRMGDKVDESHEMAAVGLSNIAVGALGGFAISASSSRTPVAYQSGGRTQAVGLAAAGFVTLIVLALPGLLGDLPIAALSAVVVAAALSLVELHGLAALWRASRPELAVSVAATLGVVLLGVLPGVSIAIGLSLLAFVWRAWNPYAVELARIDGRKGYHDVTRNPQGRRIPGLVLARFDAPLFFANAGAFEEFVLRLLSERDDDPRWLAIAAEPVTDLDTTAAEALVAIDDRLQRDGIKLVFAEMKGPIKDKLARHGLADRFKDRLFPTLGTTVDAYLAETGVEFTDWTER